MSFAALLLLALASKTVHYSALYLLGFIPLRLIAGGYHAKSHLRCFLILMASYLAFLGLLSSIPAGIVLPAIMLAAASIALVMAFAPRADANKPITDEEAIRFKRLSRIAVVVNAVSICAILVLVPDNRIGSSYALGVFTASAALPASAIKYALLSRKTNAI